MSFSFHMDLSLSLPPLAFSFYLLLTLSHLSLPSVALLPSLSLFDTTTDGQHGSLLPSDPYWVLFNLSV